VIVEASVTGLLKTLLIIVGAFVLLRFLGQLMIAKRNMDTEREMLNRQRAEEKERQEKIRKFGKTSIISDKTSKSQSGTSSLSAEDVDFEEVG